MRFERNGFFTGDHADIGNAVASRLVEKLRQLVFLIRCRSDNQLAAVLKGNASLCAVVVKRTIALYAKAGLQ